MFEKHRANARDFSLKDRTHKSMRKLARNARRIRKIFEVKEARYTVTVY